MLWPHSIGVLALLTVALLAVIATSLPAYQLLKSLPPDNKLRRFIQPPLTESQLGWFKIVFIILGAVTVTLYYA